MNGDVEGVASRPRPLSGGLWTLFSWLRRDDRASSNESLSSVGSDRTAASFAFLTPAHYTINNSPVFLPPPSPPTDSYKKRVQDRNVRRQHDRDLTLHRKYGLYRSDGTAGYDALSLPPARRIEDLSSKWERDRRATSECFQRRALHVPGKRRAPLPPIRAAVISPGTHLRVPRKRRAPQPPIKVNKPNEVEVLKSDNISIPMNSQIIREENSLQNCSTSAKDPSEKCTKKGSSSKEAKSRSDKGFLKHIFENRKRNSGIDTSVVKILPSISELDKQAATIIENGKRRALKENSNESDTLHNKLKSNTWFCIKCLRKYDSSVSECPYCIFEKKHASLGVMKNNTPKDATSNASQIHTRSDSGVFNHKNEEKQKLKEMLKEMKDSLPKRSKHEHKELITTKNNIPTESTRAQTDPVSETPTLRIGASMSSDDKSFLFSKPSTSGLSKTTSKSITPLESFQSVVTTKPVVISHHAKQNNTGETNHNLHNNQNFNIPKGNVFQKSSLAVNIQKIENNLDHAPDEIKCLQMPLRISSLLNPVYIPKKEESRTEMNQNVQHTDLKNTASNSPVKLILTKAKDVRVTKNSETSSLPATSQTPKEKCSASMGADMNEKSKINNNGIVGQNSPCLPNENISETKMSKNTTKSTNHINNISHVNPSTSTDVGVNDLKKKTFVTGGLNQHTKRRELIIQLEKSIANGDEHAAAEAAIKLAQLRLSCSVLSFSSQIMSEPTPLTPEISQTTTTSINPTKARNENAKEISNKTENNNNISNANSALHSKTEVVIAPIASSSQENSTSIKNTFENIKPVVTICKKVTENSESIEASTDIDKGNADVLISVWVEDKEATRGPIKLKTQRHANVGLLRRQAEAALGLPSHLQRWIVGRTLCIDDNTLLVTLAGSEFNAPFYLCLVETDLHVAARNSEFFIEETEKFNKNTGNNVYKELVQLEQQACVPNAEAFECGVCIEECKPGSGVILRECVHMFCKDCLADVVRHSGEPDISCPAMGCNGVLQEREIRGLVSPDDYERWLARGLAAAESGTRNAFHCRTKDCTGWALCEPGVRRFDCPVCKHSNCVPCQALHEGETCEKYRANLQAVSNPTSSRSDDSTQALLNNLINKGEALECPECKAIITKMWGCDWVKCSACKTEICWVTRGRRWGPAGRGDISAGCRCGVDGKRCHPSCGYCH